MRISRILIFIVSIVCVNSSVYATIIDGYDCDTIVNFNVCKKVYPDNSYDTVLDKIIENVTIDVTRINKFIMSSATKKKLQSVKITIDWNSSEVPAWYHVGTAWLEYYGQDLFKANSVNISNPQHFIDYRTQNQPYILLHELSHAYYHQYLSSTQKAALLDAYAKAKNKKIYELVQYDPGYGCCTLREAYANTNVEEYFSELTEAYFGKNDYYPFNRMQLRIFDPDGYRVLRSIWK